VIECSIKPATCGRGKLTTNFTIIRELHGITKSAKMRFEFVDFFVFEFDNFITIEKKDSKFE